MEFVALLSKHSIVVASKESVHQCTLHETMRVKSGAWDDNGVFIYTSTRNHINYCLPNGDNGIINSIDLPLFVSKVSGSIIRSSNVEAETHDIEFDATEYVIKLSLLKRRYSQVMSMIRRSELCRHLVITYLQQKCFPAIALRFAEDEKTRLNLALESGDIQAAVTSAKEIDDEKDHWCRLGVEAFRQGNAGIVEYAYQRTHNFERLSFLYLISGNLDKLSKIQKIVEHNDNVKCQFQNALYLGDKRECVKILENAGKLHLAYVTAAVHGLHETAKRLATELGENVPYLTSAGKSPSLLVPPRPIVCGYDWPLLSVLGGAFESGLDNVGLNTKEELEDFSITVDEEHLQHGNVKHSLRKRPMIIEDGILDIFTFNLRMAMSAC